MNNNNDVGMRCCSKLIFSSFVLNQFDTFNSKTKRITFGQVNTHYFSIFCSHLRIHVHVCTCACVSARVACFFSTSFGRILALFTVYTFSLSMNSPIQFQVENELSEQHRCCIYCLHGIEHNLGLSSKKAENAIYFAHLSESQRKKKIENSPVGRMALFSRRHVIVGCG